MLSVGLLPRHCTYPERWLCTLSCWVSCLCHAARQHRICEAMACDVRCSGHRCRSLVEGPAPLYLDNLAFLVSGAATRATTGP